MLAAACGVHEVGGGREPIAPDAAADAPEEPLEAGAERPDAPPVGVEIEGTFHPREQVLVFLHIGHSNMAGRAVSPPELRDYYYEPAPRLWSYHWMEMET